MLLTAARTRWRRCPQERRKEMTKTVSKLGEEGKVAIRNVRRDAMKAIEKLEKDGSIGGGCPRLLCVMCVCVVVWGGGVGWADGLGSGGFLCAW